MIKVSALNLFTREDKVVKVSKRRRKKNQDAKDDFMLSSFSNPENQMRQSSRQQLGNHSRSQSNFFGARGQVKDQNQIDFSSQDGQDAIQMLAEGELDYDSIDETQINDEKTKNIVHAIKLRKQKMANHSDFYYLLDKVSDRIYMYKSLFLDKRPKYIKDPTQHRISSSEIRDARMRAQEEEKKAKMLQHQKVKQKKNQFYDNLAKKTNKSIKIPSTLIRRGQVMDQMMFNSNVGVTAGGSSILSINIQNHPEIESLQVEYEKEIQRKEKLYSLKPKGVFQQRNGSQDVTNNNQNDLSKERAQLELRPQQTDMTASIRNDITYLSQMKNSLSLPYLNSVKIKDETPIQQYLHQKGKEIQESQLQETDAEKAERKKRKLLMLAEKKFLKLNQKSQITQSIQSLGSLMAKKPKVQTITIERSGDGTDRVYKRIISFPSLPKNTSIDIKSLKQIKDIIKRQNSKTQGKEQLNPILEQLKPSHDINEYYLKSARNGGNFNKLQIEQNNKKIINQ